MTTEEIKKELQRAMKGTPDLDNLVYKAVTLAETVYNKKWGEWETEGGTSIPPFTRNQESIATFIEEVIAFSSILMLRHEEKSICDIAKGRMGSQTTEWMGHGVAPTLPLAMSIALCDAVMKIESKMNEQHP